MTLTKTNNYFLRGWAILGIVFHNFFHLLPEMPKENQFIGNTDRWQTFLNFIGAHPALSFPAIMSFFGHYFVDIFIFSAMTGALLQASVQKNRLNQRLWHLYLPLFLTLLLNLVIEFLQEGSSHVIHQALPLAGAILTTLAPFTHPNDVGAFWFIAMIIQFYLLVALMPHILARRPAKIITVFITIAAIILVGAEYMLPAEPALAIWNKTVLGQVPVLLLAYMLHRFPQAAFTHWSVVLASGLMFVLLQGCGLAFPFLAVLFCLMLLALTEPLAWIAGKLRCREVLVRLGQYSLYLYLGHIIIRFPFLALAHQWRANALEVHALGILHLATSLLLARLLYLSQTWIDHRWHAAKRQ